MKCYMTQAAQGASWPVVITEWALDSYLNLRHAQVFSDQDYWGTLRPDVELLKTGIPSPEAKFQNPKFWGPATDRGVVLAAGYKMKWHNLGSGQVQLRLPVMAHQRAAMLCEAYVKTNASVEARKIARFKTHMNLIARGQYTYRGQL